MRDAVGMLHISLVTCELGISIESLFEWQLLFFDI